MADAVVPSARADRSIRSFGTIALSLFLAAPVVLLVAGFHPHPPRLEYLRTASPAVQLHLLGVVGALALGTVLLLLLRKGTRYHKHLGWAWVLLMLLGAAASMFVMAPGMARIGFRLGPFGPLHIASVWVLASLPVAVLAARKGMIKRHSRIMTNAFFGGLLIAGAFTLVPGRLMWRVFFG